MAIELSANKLIRRQKIAFQGGTASSGTESVWEDADGLKNAAKALKARTKGWSGAGAPHTYTYEKFENGQWKAATVAENAEGDLYYWTGINSKRWLDLWNRAKTSTLAGEDLANLENPGIIGYIENRGYNYYDASAARFLQTGALKKYNFSLDPKREAAGRAFIEYNSPAAQAARNKSSGFGGVLTLAAIAAAIYTGGAYAGFWGAGEAAAGSAAAAAGAEAAAAGTAAASTAASATLAESLAAGAASGFASGAASSFGGAALGTAAGVSAGTIAGTSLGLATTLETLKQAKEVVSTVQLVNKVTGQKTVVPKNSPIPAGYAIDPTWNSSIGDPAGSSLTQAIAALKGQNMNLNTANPAAVVQPGTGAVNPLVGIAMVAAVLYFVSR